MTEPEKTTAATIKRYLPAALAVGGVAAGAVATGNADALGVPDWMIEEIRKWGPAAVLIGIFLYYVPRDLVFKFVVSQQKQAEALTKISDAMESIAGRESRMEQTVAECLINDRILVSRVEGVSREVQDVQSQMATGFSDIRKLIIDGQKVSQ
jgi:hypothetical protein